MRQDWASADVLLWGLQAEGIPGADEGVTG
jgi:hypothetical protein